MSAKEQIPVLVAEWNEKARRHDLEGCVAYFAPDGRFMAPHAPAAHGTAAIRDVWAHMFTLPGLKVTFGPTSVHESAADDLAYEVGTWATGFDTPTGRHDDHGKYIVVWRKIDGAWKVMADIFNSDVPLPA